ncbi:MAG: hypothetical protein LBP58_09545 [Azoarcus sp.]|nr:hypothetical protein [Azoarcus sp.]
MMNLDKALADVTRINAETRCMLDDMKVTFPKWYDIVWPVGLFAVAVLLFKQLLS